MTRIFWSRLKRCALRRQQYVVCRKVSARGDSFMESTLPSPINEFAFIDTPWTSTSPAIGSDEYDASSQYIQAVHHRRVSVRHKLSGPRRSTSKQFRPGRGQYYRPHSPRT